jgi:phosphatidylserine/phosphatidylglycerophosphate/cardiolipin synthase-like enzyme
MPAAAVSQSLTRTESGRLAVYVGRSAGSGLYHHLLAAKRSVVAMAPYIKPLFARKLVEAAERGVDVVLVTSEDAARRREVVATLVEQTRRTSRSRQRWRRVGLLVSALLVLSAAAVWLVVTTHGALLYASYAVPAGVTGFLGCRLIRVHSYGYRFRLPRVRVIASPYYQDGAGEGFPLMVHAKVYVVDDEVAYLPSFNLTPEGFFDNFESCVQIEDPDAVRRVVDSVEALVADETLRVLDAATLGRSLYAEPRA